MNRTLIEHIVTDVLTRSNSEIEVVLENLFPGRRLVGGKYSLDDNRITLYLGVLEEQCKLLFGSLEPFEEYVRVVLAHELGHAHDPELEYLSERLVRIRGKVSRTRVSLRLEENAWRYADNLVRIENPAVFDTIRGQSLTGYYELLPEYAELIATTA
ncbi:hypothetical protein [Saccharibacillus kuerlensis]|uniref:IrrE N-terminal-like domain-containing protein n=1 Tax=Saccharibacillus kuerlensis TaxID=459527 RepID=A0ABQ2KV04_9BACL|nr:hypothetical protein [Saccharibacillus kuerlensis]GGN93642.1 hypothetical protein GCM10010969_07620 [Saccharibacillus kuerlensis]